MAPNPAERSDFTCIKHLHLSWLVRRYCAPFGGTGVTVGDGSRFSRARSQLPHDSATANGTLALPLLSELPWGWFCLRSGAASESGSPPAAAALLRSYRG